MSEFRMAKLGARTLRSGLNFRQKGSLPTFQPRAGLYRGIVLKTYATDDPSRKTNGRSATTRTYEVECDVLLAKTFGHYPRVPVQQPVHGVDDASLWIPRGCTRSLDGSPLNLTAVSTRGTAQSLPTSLKDLDGDNVIVQFIDGDPACPLITGAVSHRGTKRLVATGPGWQELDGGLTRGTPFLDEKYVRFRGVEMRINKSGDVLLDTVGAAGLSEIDGVPPDLFTGGQVRVRVKPGQRLTVQVGSSDVLEVYDLLGVPQVDLIEGATEPFVKGLALSSALATLTGALNAYAGALLAPGAPPGAVTLVAATAAATALTTALGAFSTQLSTALSLQIRGK
jgi:hypothetical protein